VALIFVLLFYPILYVINLCQFIYIVVVYEEGAIGDVLMPFEHLVQGVKYVLLFPCLMFVSN
jgi:hypothetical protein